MSAHPSWKLSGGKTTSRRNVLKRFERINILMQEGRWKPGDRVFGLPKTRVQ
jgi:small basic protein (TIGR04137 family)